MRAKMEDFLIKYVRKTITLGELETVLPSTTYEQFAQIILQLEAENVLEMIKSQGRNSFQPSLAYKYRLHKHPLKRTFYKTLQSYRTKLHMAIDLDAYFKFEPSYFFTDLADLEKIDTYIRKHGLPTEKVPAPERSFEMMADEKWIEQGGLDVLERTNLVAKLKILPVSDPLMMAINPNRLNDATQYHLVVENKTPYQAILPVLFQSQFATLIYGVGQKIAKSIENFPAQYPVKANHKFLYFGDIDRSGIKIWYDVASQVEATPALPFYRTCFTKKAAFGKTNQQKNETAIHAFLTYFTAEEQTMLWRLLEKGAYYPQETLKTKELQLILLKTNWEAFF